jgi:hypothetical protein
LSGRNKPAPAVRSEEEKNQPGPLRKMIGSYVGFFQPDQQWDAEHSTSKPEVNADLKAKFKLAVQLQPGKPRNSREWEDELGFNDKARVPAQPIHTQQPQSAINKAVVNGAIKHVQQQPASTEFQRKTRGKKRGYGDESFVGYGEGYVEDDEDERPNKRGRFGDMDD